MNRLGKTKYHGRKGLRIRHKNEQKIDPSEIKHSSENILFWEPSGLSVEFRHKKSQRNKKDGRYHRYYVEQGVRKGGRKMKVFIDEDSGKPTEYVLRFSNNAREPPNQTNSDHAFSGLSPNTVHPPPQGPIVPVEPLAPQSIEGLTSFAWKMVIMGIIYILKASDLHLFEIFVQVEERMKELGVSTKFSDDLAGPTPSQEFEEGDDFDLGVGSEDDGFSDPLLCYEMDIGDMDVYWR